MSVDKNIRDEVESLKSMSDFFAANVISKLKKQEEQQKDNSLDEFMKISDEIIASRQRRREKGINK